MKNTQKIPIDPALIEDQSKLTNTIVKAGIETSVRLLEDGVSDNQSISVVMNAIINALITYVVHIFKSTPMTQRDADLFILGARNMFDTPVDDVIAKRIQELVKDEDDG